MLTRPAKIRQNGDPTRPAVPSDPWTTLVYDEHQLGQVRSGRVGSNPECRKKSVGPWVELPRIRGPHCVSILCSRLFMSKKLICSIHWNECCVNRMCDIDNFIYLFLCRWIFVHFFIVCSFVCLFVCSCLGYSHIWIRCLRRNKKVDTYEQ